MVRSGLRRLATELLTAVGNCVFFLVAFFVGLRVVYPVVFAELRMGSITPGSHAALSEQHAILLSVSVVFLLAGGLATVWTRHVLGIVITSAAMFLAGMTILAVGMYVADRGDPGIMWPYVRPRALQYVGAAYAAAAATAGFLGFRLLSRIRAT